MAAQAQLQEMRRRALPGGAPTPPVPGMSLGGQPSQQQSGPGTGQYL
jgi:hypothetical protein